MASTKVSFIAFFFIAMLVASSVPTTNALGCFKDCYDRCANGKIGNVPCATMCAQACIVPDLKDIEAEAKLNGGN